MTTSIESPTNTGLDQARADAFAERMFGVLRAGSLALLCSIGDQTGLFDALGEAGSVTSAELAERAGLQERYVREWLGGQVVGGIVEYDPATGRYTLPPEHAASLTSAAGPGNLAHVMQFLPLLGEVEQQVIECFRSGGGVPYSAYPRFHRMMAEDTAAVFDAALLDGVLPMVDGLPARLETGIAVADIGCGSGHAINLMARAYPASTFVGYDFEAEAIRAARAEAAEWGLANATFEVQDVAELDGDGTYDLVTAFDAIHDQAHPAEVLARIHRALAPRGRFLMVDTNASSRLEKNVDSPFGPFLYTASLLHCMTVSLSQGGDGLGTVWGRELAVGMLDDAGFTDIVVHEIDDDPFNLYFVATKPA